jgi:DNA repair exonuclease SbcCD nuclease subunit
MVRLIHTGDVHIGRPFQFLGEFGRIVSAQIRETFARVLALAPARDAAAVLVAGDLFDRHHPDVSDVRFALAEIRKLRPIPVVVLPGTHDLLSPDSVYCALRDPPDNLVLMSADPPQPHVIESAGLAIHGRANRAKRGGEPPLWGIQPDPRARFNVAMAHASVPRGDIGTDPDQDYVVTAADIQATGAQYCALGHWHKCAEQFPGQPFRAWYCGSPETLQFEDGEDSGFALEVVLDEGRTEVVPHRVGKYRWREVALAVAALHVPEDVRRALEGLAAPDRILRLLLEGTLSGTAAFDPEAIRERLADRFAHLILDTASLHTRWEDFDPETVFPPGTIGAAFIGLAQERLREAAESDRTLWEEVLRRGTALLAGREDVG